MDDGKFIRARVTKLIFVVYFNKHRAGGDVDDGDSSFMLSQTLMNIP